MAIDRVRVPITGSGVVGTSAINFYFVGVTGSDLTALRQLINALVSYLPNTTTYTIPSGGDELDEKTGKLTGNWSAVAPSAVTGSSTSIGSAVSGFMIRWRTGGVIDGHRPVGRSIFVPASTLAYTTGGFITGGLVSAANTAGATFLTSSPSFRVWHRPLYTGKPPNRVLVRDGAAVAPNVVDTSNKPVVLKSRRD